MEVSDMATIIQQSWADVVHTFSPGWIELTIVFGAQILGFWLPSAVFLAIDLSFPAWSSRHKLQSEKRQPSMASILLCLRYVGLSFAAQTGIQVVSQLEIVTRGRPNPTPFRVETEFPTLKEFCLHFVFSVLAREVLFYTAHRVLHHPKLYPLVHKKHHLFTAPVAFAAQYAHPVEHILANAMPIFLPMAHILPLLGQKAHILTFAGFMLYELLQTTTSHSGYECFWNARIHDRHHEKFNVNFGTIGVVDWMLGTDREGWHRKAEVVVLRTTESDTVELVREQRTMTHSKRRD